jgi:hypothetical protein
MSDMQLSARQIDFDHWSELAKSDPDSFEQLRNRTLQACISRSSSDHQDRLRCLQWRIDQIRSQSGTPLAACVKISGIMWDTFNRLGTLYNQAAQLKAGTTLPNPQSAKIIPFPKA